MCAIHVMERKGSRLAASLSARLFRVSAGVEDGAALMAAQMRLMAGPDRLLFSSLCLIRDCL